MSEPSQSIFQMSGKPTRNFGAHWVWVANAGTERLIKCLRSIAVDGTGRIMFTENAKQDCGHPWTPESTFVSPALP
jgi:hypothetical protein